MRLKQIVKRALLTYVDTLLGLVLASGILQGTGNQINVSTLQTLAIGALPAAISVLRNALSEIPAVNISAITTLPPE